MSNIWIPNKKVFCPLCKEPFSIRKGLLPDGRIIKIYYCKTDNIFTFDFDPAFNKWMDSNKIISCPECQEEMRWFLRHVDGYMKAYCPSCGLAFEKDSGSTVNESGEIEMEEFDQEEPEETEIQIPISKLKLSEDKKQWLKKVIRKKNNEK